MGQTARVSVRSATGLPFHLDPLSGANQHRLAELGFAKGGVGAQRRANWGVCPIHVQEIVIVLKSGRNVGLTGK
jgi:hypothetical protein